MNANRGRHRSPLPPIRGLRLFTPVAVLAGFGSIALPVVLIAIAVAPNSTAANAPMTSAPTASRTAHTTHVPLAILPATPPSIGAEGAWDPETDAPIPVSAPVSPGTFARVTGTATGSTARTADPVATAAPLTTEQQPTTLPGATTRTWTRTTTRIIPPPSPASVAATSSAPTTTEETTPVTETSSSPPDVIEDAIDEVLGETP